jgi:hypothetical protein
MDVIEVVQDGRVVHRAYADERKIAAMALDLGG